MPTTSIPSRSRSRRKAPRHADAVPPTHCVTLKSIPKKNFPLSLGRREFALGVSFTSRPSVSCPPLSNLGVCGGELICPTPTPHPAKVLGGKLGNFGSIIKAKMPKFSCSRHWYSRSLEVFAINSNWARLSGYVSLKNRKSSIFHSRFRGS